MYLNDKLQTMSRDWQKSLELQIPSGTVSNDDIAAYCKEKKSDFNAIEGFIQIVQDWVEDSINKVEASGVTK